MNKLCLNMIVKNESKIIRRLFDTVVKIIDYWVIADTGSTDETPSIIEKYFEEKNIPGKIVYHEWKNFGHNRTLALKSAQETSFDFEYVLLLDADMKLVVLPAFDKNKLTCDIYGIKQGSSELSYYNTRLLKKKLNVTCKGPTHEYYDIAGEHTNGTLHELYIDDIGDGGAKGDKFERDIRLLKQGILDEPDNCRYYFYLARSYECVGDCENAIKNYNERINRGGWPEEVWYSYYSIGNIYMRQNKLEHAIYNYLMAYEVIPNRLENLCKLIEIYRVKAKHKLANQFIEIATQSTKTTGYDERGTLFMEPPAYKYMLDYEKSIIYYYINKREEGAKIAHELMLHNKLRNVAPHVYGIVSRNFKFYAKDIKSYGGQNIATFSISDILSEESNIEKFDDYKHVSNPSVTMINGTTCINLRCINYNMEIKDNNLCYKVNYDGELVGISVERPVLTVNIMCTLDKNMKICNTYKLNDNNIDESLTKHDETVRGIEDIRIIQYQNNAYFVGNSREYTDDHSPKMMLGKINLKSKRVEKIVRLHEYEDNKCQKNWSPFVHDDKLLLVYSFSPLVILEPNLDTGKCTVYKNQKQLMYYDEYKGGSQGFYVSGVLYFIVHEVVFESGRIYYHRVVKMNKKLEIENVSPRFYFDEIGIEFVAGATYDDINEIVLISWGKKDASGILTSIPGKSLKKMFLK